MAWPIHRGMGHTLPEGHMVLDDPEHGAFAKKKNDDVYLGIEFNYVRSQEANKQAWLDSNI